MLPHVRDIIKKEIGNGLIHVFRGVEYFKLRPYAHPTPDFALTGGASTTLINRILPLSPSQLYYIYSSLTLSCACVKQLEAASIYIVVPRFRPKTGTISVSIPFHRRPRCLLLLHIFAIDEKMDPDTRGIANNYGRGPFKMTKERVFSTCLAH